MVSGLVHLNSHKERIRMNLRHVRDHAQELFYRLFGKSHVCGCGHKTKKKALLTIHGKKGVYHVTDLDYCPQCWANAAIKCAWCADTIVPGEAITLKTPAKDFQVPNHAQIYKKEPRLQLVGCMHCDPDAIMDRAGFWVMPGKVLRAASPTEIIANGMLGEDEVYTCNNIMDPTQAILIPDEVS